MNRVFVDILPGRKKIVDDLITEIERWDNDESA